MADGAQRSEATGPGDAVPDYLSVTVEELIELVASSEPVPAGGSVAALAATLAAALAVMTARLSTDHWELAPATAAQARLLQDRLRPLAQEDAAAYLRALQSIRGVGSSEELGPAADQPERDRELAAALNAAAVVPLRIAESAADVAELAADTAQFGNPAVAADAAAAVAVAHAAARAAAHIVGVNLGVTEGDEMLGRAQRAAEAAEAASARAFAAVQ